MCYWMGRKINESPRNWYGENPTKELIIQTIYNALQQIDNISSVNVENKAKLITFELNNEQFKVDLVQKRKPKA